MKILILLFSLLSLKVQAQVVLVPEKSYPLDTYLSRCRQPGYICTQDFFKSLILSQSTPKFDDFLEKIDLYNEEFRQQSLAKIKNFLKEEYLDLTQVDLVLKIIDKQLSVEPHKALADLKKNLKSFVNDLQDLSDSTSDAESYIVFKKVISRKQYLSIKYNAGLAKVTRITPYSGPLGTDSFLLVGTCNDFQMSPALQQSLTAHFMPLFTEECSQTEMWTKSSLDSKSLWSEYQKPLLYTVIGTAAILFLSQYQLQIQY